MLTFKLRDKWCFWLWRTTTRSTQPHAPDNRRKYGHYNTVHCSTEGLRILAPRWAARWNSLCPPKLQEGDLGPHEAHVRQLGHHAHDAVEHVPRAHPVVVDDGPAPAGVIVTVRYHQDLTSRTGDISDQTTGQDIRRQDIRVSHMSSGCQRTTYVYFKTYLYVRFGGMKRKCKAV